MFDLTGKVALVTGVGSPAGIGFASAKLLAKAGAKIFITSTTDRVFEREKYLKSLFGKDKLYSLAADLTEEDQVLNLSKTIVIVFILHYFLKYHKFGLWIRLLGENPEVLRSSGVNPVKIKFLVLLLCGILCGLAGAQLSISNVGLFVENMSAGRGWIAVVAVLLCGGKPIPLFFLIVLFGLVDSLSLRIQGLGLPQQITELLPYIMCLVVLIIVSYKKLRTLSRTIY